MRTDAFIPENANEETLMLQGSDQCPGYGAGLYQEVKQ